MRIGLAVVLVVSFFLCVRAHAQLPPLTPDKQLEVVIISVENFDDPQYQNALLQTNIQKATDQLINFFSTRFPTAKRTVLRGHDETTSGHLTEFFRGTFRQLVNGNITLLFILSHGEALPAPIPVFGSTYDRSFRHAG